MCVKSKPFYKLIRLVVQPFWSRRLTEFRHSENTLLEEAWYNLLRTDGYEGCVCVCVFIIM